MGLDVSALRQKLNELKGGSARNDILWKPTEGENLIRIVPLKGSPSNPFTELYFHYLGRNTYLSPISFGERDPIAEFGDALISAGGLSKDEYKEAKKFTPQCRTFVPIIDRKKPEQGVRYWAFAKTVYTELLNIMADPETDDITDPQLGRDLKITFVPQEKSDTGFAKTTARIALKQTPLTKDAEELERWLNEQPDLMSLKQHKRLSYDELNVILKTFIDGPSAAPTTRKVVETNDSDWGSASDVSPTASKSAKATKKASAVDVEDQFAEMFDEE